MVIKDFIKFHFKMRESYLEVTLAFIYIQESCKTTC